MAQNIQINPVTRDYVVVNGSPVSSDRILEKAFIAITIPQGKWLYGAIGQGSLVYTLAQQKRAASLEQLFSQYTQDAIQRQLINTGQAVNSSTTNLQATRTGSSNEINVVPAATQLSNQLSFVST
jgi:hypothetical protein